LVSQKKPKQPFLSAQKPPETRKPVENHDFARFEADFKVLIGLQANRI
jgi:hypothetical protein